MFNSQGSINDYRLTHPLSESEEDFNQRNDDELKSKNGAENKHKAMDKSHHAAGINFKSDHQKIIDSNKRTSFQNLNKKVKRAFSDVIELPDSLIKIKTLFTSKNISGLPPRKLQYYGRRGEEFYSSTDFHYPGNTAVSDTVRSNKYLENGSGDYLEYGNLLLTPVKNVFMTGLNDALSLVKSPFEWDSSYFFIVPPVVLGTYILSIFDEPVHSGVMASRKYEKSAVMKFGEFYGRPIVPQVSALVLNLYGLAANSPKANQIGLEIYESYLIANGITTFLKGAFGRARPYDNKGAYNFTPFPSGANGHYALPSGHTTVAFSVSSVLASYAKSTWLKALIYSPAVITAVSRVYNNHHWFSDVFLGGAIGYLVGNYLVSRHNNIEKNSSVILGFDDSGRLGLLFLLP